MDRYYRARCAHGLWVALMTGDAAQDDHLQITCPHGCTVILLTEETAPQSDD